MVTGVFVEDGVDKGLISFLFFFFFSFSIPSICISSSDTVDVDVDVDGVDRTTWVGDDGVGDVDEVK